MVDKSEYLNMIMSQLGICQAQKCRGINYELSTTVIFLLISIILIPFKEHGAYTQQMHSKISEIIRNTVYSKYL